MERFQEELVGMREDLQQGTLCQVVMHLPLIAQEFQG